MSEQVVQVQDEKAITIAIYGRRIEILEKALKEIIDIKTVERNTLAKVMQKIARKAVRPKG